MTDGQLLLAVFAAFYLAECVHWLPLHSVVFSTWTLHRGWGSSRPSPLASANGCGAAFAWPLPPLGSFLTTQEWPIIPATPGLWIGPGQLHEGKRLDWADLRPVLEQRSLKLGAGIEVKCSSVRAAELLLTFLTQTAAMEPDLRAQAVEVSWHQSLSLPRARAALRRFRLGSAGLRLPCLFVAFLAFAYVPLLYWRFGGSSLQMLFAVIGLFLLTSLVAFTWRSLARRLFPEKKDGLWGEVLHQVFMPAHAIRAIDVLGVGAMAGIHPLAAAAVVLRPEALRAFASLTWREWKHRPVKDPLHSATVIVLPQIKAFSKRIGFSIEELEAPPERQSGATCYCPRCQAQFTVAGSQCEQCGGVATVTWPI